MTLAIQPAPWVEAALCGQTDPDAFHPGQGESPRAAKAVCARCDVRADCLAEALANPSSDGVWGGTTEHQRRRIRRDDAARARKAL